MSRQTSRLTLAESRIRIPSLSDPPSGVDRVRLSPRRWPSADGARRYRRGSPPFGHFPTGTSRRRTWGAAAHVATGSTCSSTGAPWTSP
eukprot:6812925-Pyramimonas_sp.AAC.1